MTHPIAERLYAAAADLSTATSTDITRDDRGQVVRLTERRAPSQETVLADLTAYVSTLPPEVHLDTPAMVDVLDAGAAVAREAGHRDLAANLEAARDAAAEGGIIPSQWPLGWVGRL